ncbi:MAG: flagellar biosynthesis protein FlhB [Thermodesulfobacteria bacterium]|nr:flagellar biosynthesis protein FlhB [Thermodesulfobacteriota bacterium]
MGKKPKVKRAVALRYKAGEDSAPKITAKGKGTVAEKIIELAREAGVPIKEQADLVEVLSKLDLNSEIPPETYVVVAQILAWVYEVNKKAGK